MPEKIGSTWLVYLQELQVMQGLHLVINFIVYHNLIAMSVSQRNTSCNRNHELCSKLIGVSEQALISSQI